MKYTPMIVGKKNVPVNNIGDLCDVIRDNNRLFASAINELDRRNRRTNKGALLGITGLFLLWFCNQKDIFDIDKRLNACEEALNKKEFEEE